MNMIVKSKNVPPARESDVCECLVQDQYSK